jgi:hypothetical protein
MTKRTALASLFALALAAGGAAQAQAPRDGDVLGGGGASTITYSPAAAERLKPVQAHGIDLGAASGVAYYTVERGGFRVVVTLAQRGEDATVPVRFEAVLAPGQSVVLSTPRGAGIPPDAVEISRHADTVLVRQGAAAVTN